MYTPPAPTTHLGSITLTEPQLRQISTWITYLGKSCNVLVSLPECILHHDTAKSFACIGRQCRAGLELGDPVPQISNGLEPYGPK